MAKIEIDTKHDFSSKTLEKAMEHAKGFLSKLIVPAVEEFGFLLKDHVSFWRLKHYVKTLNKADAYCRKFNIEPKKIPVKLLSPLIDFASLEEDEQLQDKWAILLGNLVDSEQNIQNHVFPYILSQISINEFLALEATHKAQQERVKKIQAEYEVFKTGFPEIEKKIQEEIKEINSRIADSKDSQNFTFEKFSEKHKKEGELHKLRYQELSFLQEIRKLEYMIYAELKKHEITNLVRLGLIKVIPRSSAYVSSTKKVRSGAFEHFDPASLQSLELAIEYEEDDHFLSELGELFVQACSEKKNKSDH